MLKKFILFSIILSTHSVFADTQIGIIASLSPATTRTISFNTDTRHATQALKNHTQGSGFIYWLQRLNSDHYHVTLDLLQKADGSQFTPADLTHVETILTNFSRYARELNKQRPKAYNASAYELRLFVHYTDGTHEQFTAQNINTLLARGKDVSYANLVLKLGTEGKLRDDWTHLQQNILTKPHHAAYQRVANHHLETHITIANLFKYSKAQNQIVGKTVQRNNGRPGWNEPFNQTDLNVLIDAFNQTHTQVNFNRLQGLKLDRVQITGKLAGQLVTHKTVKF